MSNQYTTQDIEKLGDYGWLDTILQGVEFYGASGWGNSKQQPEYSPEQARAKILDYLHKQRTETRNQVLDEVEGRLWIEALIPPSDNDPSAYFAKGSNNSLKAIKAIIEELRNE